MCAHTVGAVRTSWPEEPAYRRVFAGGNEVDQTKLFVRANLRRVVRDQLPRDIGQCVSRHADVEPYVVQGTKQPLEMIVQAK